MSPEEFLYSVLLFLKNTNTFKIRKQESELDDGSIFILAKGSLQEMRSLQSVGKFQILSELNVTHFFPCFFFCSIKFQSSNKETTVVGWDSFITGQKRKTSIVSKDFATVYEIKKEDFQKILLSNSADYVILSLLKAKIFIFFF